MADVITCPHGARASVTLTWWGEASRRSCSGVAVGNGPRLGVLITDFSGFSASARSTILRTPTKIRSSSASYGEPRSSQRRRGKPRRSCFWAKSVYTERIHAPNSAAKAARFASNVSASQVPPKSDELSTC